MIATLQVGITGQESGMAIPQRAHALPGGDDLAVLRESLSAVAWRITGDREQAYDIVQDVLCDHLAHPEKFAGSSSIKTYLYRMAINRSIDCCRRRSRFAGIMELLGRERRPALDNVFEMKDMIRHLLADIAAEYRVPFVLAEGEGMTYGEIASILKVSMNTVRTRIYRCREKLKKKLQATGYPL